MGKESGNDELETKTKPNSVIAKKKQTKKSVPVPPPIPGNNFVGGSIFVEIFLNWRFVLALNETCLYCNCGPPYSGGPLFGAHSK